MNARRVTTKLRIPSLARVGLGARKRYLVYEPARGKLVGVMTGSELREMPVSLPGHGHALLYLRGAPKARAALVFATGADEVSWERWEGKEEVLEFALRGPEGAEADVAVLSPGRPREVRCGERAVRFSYNARQKLVKAGVVVGRAVRVVYQG
jgi:hypothetical protein